MISFKHVGKEFSSGITAKRVTAVHDVSFDVKEGEIFGIIGPNGAGKSTLLKMLMGFIRPSTGSISIFDIPSNATEVRKKIGYLPENPYYYDHLSAEELMRFSGSTSGMNRDDINERMTYLLRVMNLSHAQKRKLRTYSKGMTQRAGICFALIHDPDLIIFDEPMSGLDPLGRALVVDLIFELKRKKKTVLFCSHILNDVERLCDRMAIMDQGQLKTVLTKDMIRDKYELTTITVDSLSDSIRSELTIYGAEIRSEDGCCKIQITTRKLTECLKLISSNEIKILQIEQTSDILEHMFLETITNRYSYE